MKKKILIIIVIVTIFVSGIFVDKLLFSNKDVEDGINEPSPVKHEHMLSMMLETDSGSGEYSLEERSSWPTKEDGYVFNSTLSKCEKGSKLSWDNENNLVLMEGTTSDKCYVYFDVYVEPTVLLADYVKSQYTGTQGDNNLYYHDSSLANGAGDNSYRYAGSSDTTNNFVCFGSDKSTCSDDNLYRIIGVFGDQVKLIKWDYATDALLGTDGDYSNTYNVVSNETWGANKGTNAQSVIGAYYWNNDGTTYGTNTWSVSKLNVVNLNTNYINNIGNIWISKIANTDWKVGGNIDSNTRYAIAATVYNNEITSPVENTTYSSKIGLIYTSDYGFAAAPSVWTVNLGLYDSSYDNWMYMGLFEWTMVRLSGNNNAAFYVDYDGCIDYNYVGTSKPACAVRPVFYLNSDVEYDSGTGTKTDPYRIKLD